MPFSSNSGKQLVDRAIIRTIKQSSVIQKRKRVLDIGVGSGTYFDRYSKTWLKGFNWSGVEIWEPYIEQYQLKKKYDVIHQVTAQEFFLNAPANIHYDICFMGDVVEHMPQDEAIKAIDQALNICGVVIISIPIGSYPQGEYEGNPYERHIKDDWSVEDAFKSFPNICFYGVDGEIGVFICSRLFEKEYKKLLAPQIGVYGICKNEINFIDRCLNSVKQADAIMFCDTGSTDGTYEHLFDLHAQWAGEWGALKVSKIHVNPWRFDDARNCALMSLPEELDVCVSIDGDEMLEAGWYEKVSAAVEKDLQTKGYPTDRYNHRFMTIWDWQGEGKSISEHWHERIHSRKGFMWKLPVHEVLVKSDGSAEAMGWLKDVMMVQKPDTTKPRGSYLPLLEQSAKEDPKRWKTFSFLAGEYQGAGQLDKALDALDHAMKQEGADKAFLSYQKSRMYQAKGDFDWSIMEMLNTCKAAPQIREYRVYLAQVYLAAGRKSDAYAALDQAAKITERTYGYEYNPSCWGEAFEIFKASIVPPEPPVPPPTRILNY